MSACGKACCMYIGNIMKHEIQMPNMHHGGFQGSPDSLPANRRNRRFSESEAQRPGACHDTFK
jgi:hypothetical protein